MSNNTNKNHGKHIGNIVRSALQSGDLSRLKDLGPAIQDAVEENIPGVNITGSTGNQGQQQQQAPPPPPPPSAPPRYAWQGQSYTAPVRPGMPNRNKGMASFVLGVLGMVAFGLGAMIFAALGLLFGAGGVFTGLATGFGACFLGCAVVTGVGSGTRRLMGNLSKYYALLQQKPVRTFDELAEQTGREAADIRRDFRKARQKNLLPDVRTDAGETCVMRGEEAWRLYLESEDNRKKRESEEAERQRRMSDPATAGIEAFKNEGEATIRKIREANDAIPGEEISGKLLELERITARIFGYVEEHPEKLPDTRKFLNYYLPTTLKLVEKYREYEEMDLQPSNIQNAKRDIENTLDTINVAFGNLLESLYHDDTLDVSTDISVLQQMLEQEGLTGKKFNIDSPQ